MKIIAIILVSLGIFCLYKSIQIFRKPKSGSAGGVVIASFLIIFGLGFIVSGLGTFAFSLLH